MNEKIFKTLGQIGASGIVVGIITVIVGVSVGVVSIVSGATCPEIKRENNDLKMVGTGLHTGSLKCIIGNIKSKKNGNENNQSIFQICSGKLSENPRQVNCRGYIFSNPVKGGISGCISPADSTAFQIGFLILFFLQRFPMNPISNCQYVILYNIFRSAFSIRV